MRNANVHAAADQDSAVATAGFSPRTGKYSSSVTSILIVDDEPLIRWSVGESLAARGYNIVEAGSALEARACLAQSDFGVVLLDLKLPDSADLTLLHTVLRQPDAPRVILMTAHGSAEILEEAIKAGAFRAIKKPFDLDDMVDIVCEAVVA
jgi:DNA-binding NtrC family response regulator